MDERDSSLQPFDGNWADIERIQVGDTSVTRRRITKEDVDSFTELSGDNNPLHTDENVVRLLGHSSRIAHGVLSLGLVSKLIGTALPGPGALWRKLTIEFARPVRVGHEIEAKVTVTRVSRSVGIVMMDVEVVRLPDTLALHGNVEVMVTRNPNEIAVGQPEGIMTLEGQVAIVTGASRGIGRATAMAFGQRGVRVVVNYRADAKSADQTVRDIQEQGGNAVAVQADVSQSDQVTSLVETALAQFGRIDVLVNNATPPTSGKLLMSADYSDILTYLDVYVKGTLELVQQIVPDMKKRKYGRIVNILTSYLAEVPPRMGAYIAAKSALNGLSRSLAIELAPFNISVNMVSPSMAFSDLTADMGEQAMETARRKIPLQRLAEPHEVAQAVLFLASPESSFVSGANLPVTGGVLF